MSDLAPRASLLRRRFDESLILALHDSCEAAVAFARLDAALDAAVSAIEVPALTVERRETRSGHTRTVRFLMRWCFQRGVRPQLLST
jgi:hypothetical protein